MANYGQFITNILDAAPDDIWYYEDDKMIKFIDDFMNDILRKE